MPPPGPLFRKKITSFMNGSQFKTSSAQSLATRARAIPDLEATAHIYLQPASTEKLPHLKAEGMYLVTSTIVSQCP